MPGTTPPPTPPDPDRHGARDTAWAVFLVFLRLGLTSFGGPIAHLAYFRAEFVARRRWLDDAAYSDLVALCQFLPGPASSQVGMALGLKRAGWRGMLAAWAGFTLPSALALTLFALGLAQAQHVAGSGWVHGLKVVAVAIVAQAVWGMSRTLCPDRPRAAVAVAGALLALLLPTAWGQVVAIGVAGLAGWLFLSAPAVAGARALAYPVSRTQGWLALGLFTLLLVALPAWSMLNPGALASVIDGVYRAGALVFGGGHVVLPLLEAAVVPTGVVSESAFLAGYGAAQAVPGPLFTFAAYLGAVAQGPLHGWLGGLLLLLVIFVPACLILVAALPFWQTLQNRSGIRRALVGVNAGVVGLLVAALYDPVWTHAILRAQDFALALVAFVLLTVGRVAPLPVVALAAVAGMMLG